MDFNLAHLWAGMGVSVKVIAIVLSIQALACIAVTIDRLALIVVGQIKSRRFAGVVGAPLKAGDKTAVLALMKEAKGAHLAEYLETGLRTFADRRAGGHDEARAAEFANRALERKAEVLSGNLNKGMNVLASTGSTAPFIGLLGTVLGILNAFKLVSQEGSGGMSTIGVPISEALIVTGFGLVVAIPSVLLFNFLSAKIAAYESGLGNAGKELVDQLEAGVIQLSDKPSKSASDKGLEGAAAVATA